MFLLLLFGGDNSLSFFSNIQFRWLLSPQITTAWGRRYWHPANNIALFFRQIFQCSKTGR
jgi:hypothetical protein